MFLIYLPTDDNNIFGARGLIIVKKLGLKYNFLKITWRHSEIG